MSQKLQPVRGTKDLFFDEARKHEHIIKVAREVGELYGFEPFFTPIFEFTEVFKRTLGETSDVVNKEMYTFEDKGGDSITLRPEFTAGIARAFISNGLQQHLPIKAFSYGPLFRYERPQKGRQRQFHQVNFEWLGEASSYADVEVILMAAQFLHRLGILRKTKLLYNTLGDAETRHNYTKALVRYLNKYKNELSEDSRQRLEKNPLRILDSKDITDRRIIEEAPRLNEYWSEKTRTHYSVVRNELEGIELLQGRLMAESKLVRGLDYYNHTVFEFIAESDEVGAQNTVLAGGRYDGLIKQMGGTDTPAIGFAAGIERLVLLVDSKAEKKRPVVVISLQDAMMQLGKKEILAAIPVATMIRDQNVYVEVVYTNKIAKGFEKANKMNASHVVIIGEAEASQRKMTVKNMDTGEQPPSMKFDDALEFIIGKRPS